MVAICAHAARLRQRHNDQQRALSRGYRVERRGHHRSSCAGRRMRCRPLQRHLSKRMSRSRVRRLVNVLVSLFTPLARTVGHLPPRYRRVIKGFLPIASYWGELPLNSVQQREWAMLDTEDWLTPTYDESQ